ncbi:MAG: PP2C family protein-serine/threonine phosphatase [Bacteroidota bacterium]
MTNGFARVNKLERELHLRQLQVQRLLQITQAINNNVSAPDLFAMYRGFLQHELQLTKMALFVRTAGTENWRCVSQLGLKDKDCQIDISAELQAFKRPGESLKKHENPFLAQFNVIVPVLHKEIPIAYVLIGPFAEENDMYERVQIITTITNVIAVAIENKRLFKRQIEQERLEADLELGAQVQSLLIPDELPTTDRYELSAIYQPVMGVGGDYFDYVEFKDGKLVFCIGDFSGKGVSAALLMANFQANFQTLIRKRMGLQEFVTEINDAVFRITEGDRFVTFFVAEYDLHSGVLKYVNAGHPPAVLVTEDGVKLLNDGTMVLGSFPDLPILEIGKINIPDQAMIVTYTDGLTDLQSPAGEYFEENILYDFARRQYGRSANDFNRALRNKLEEFRGNTAFPDDLTILSCRVFNELVDFNVN